MITSKQPITEYLPEGGKEGILQFVLGPSSGCRCRSVEVQRGWVGKEDVCMPEVHHVSSPRLKASLGVCQPVVGNPEVVQ